MPTGSKKHLEDAVAFSDFLQQYLTISNTHSTWLSDVLSYERVKLKMLQGKTFFICDRFDYNLESLINNLDFNPLPVLKFQFNIGIWFRLTPKSNWRSLFFPIPQFYYILNPVLKY